MDPDVMTTLLGDAICNIEEEEYWEACQHALKSPYEAKTRDKEGGEAPSNEDEGSNNKGDSSSDSSSSDNGHGEDDSNNDSESNNSEDYDSQYSGNDWDKPPCDREDEDEGLYYEDYDDDVDYYDGDIEDDAEIEPIDMGSDARSDQYRLVNVLEAAREEIEEADDVDYDDYPYGRLSDWSCITNVSSKSCPRYDKHGREIPELGSFYNSELGSLTLYTEEKDDINARLAALDQKLMIHSLRSLTLENSEGDDEKMEGNKSKYLPQYTHLSNKGKQDLFNELMDNIEHLDAYVTAKPTDMEIDDEGMDYMDEDPLVLMLREEGTCWEPHAIIEATT